MTTARGGPADVACQLHNNLVKTPSVNMREGSIRRGWGAPGGGGGGGSFGYRPQPSSPAFAPPQLALQGFTSRASPDEPPHDYHKHNLCGDASIEAEKISTS